MTFQPRFKAPRVWVLGVGTGAKNPVGIRHRICVALAIVFSLLIGSASALAQLNLGGAYQRTVSVGPVSGVSTDQTDFPVLIHCTTCSYLAGTQYGGRVQSPQGFDILFSSDAAAQHLLDFEIDTYDPTTGAINIWVRLPTLSHSDNTIFYMTYGVAGVTASLENKLGVWRNQFLSVYHFGDATSINVSDSASAGYNLSGTATATTAQIGGGVAFSGDPTVYLYKNEVSMYPSGQAPVTIEAWASMPLGTAAALVGYGENSADGSRVALGTNGVRMEMEFENMGTSSLQPQDASWHHYAGVYGGGGISASSPQVYVDGAVNSNLPGYGTPNVLTSQLKVGGIPTVDFCCGYTGSIDEVRISSVARSSDWIKVEYANQSAPASFATFGPEIYVNSSPSEGTLSCAPSTFYQGGNTTCFVSFPAGATGQVSFSVDGQAPITGSPDALGIAEVLIPMATASAAAHNISFSYPGDGVNAPANGTTSVRVVSGGAGLPALIIYQYSIGSFDANGNVTSYLDSVNGLWSQIQYDSLNRLVSAQVTPAMEESGANYFCWAYDSFGNRTSQVISSQPITTNGTNCTPQSATTATWSGINTTYTPNNQISSTIVPQSQASTMPFTYDPLGSGNITADGQDGLSPSHNYLYDGENRLCAVQMQSAVVGVPGPMVGYVYDAEGNRVAQGSISSWSCDTDTNGFSLTKEFVVGQSGEQIAEFDGGSWDHTNAYAAGRLIATFNSSGWHYYLADWLQTKRMQVSSNGTMESSCQSLPFGDAQNCDGSDATRQHFTGKERDTESGLDYFGARYYASNMGRWMSPDYNEDPQPIPYAELSNPQTLNLYTYVINNPLSMIDTDGHTAPCPSPEADRKHPVIAARPCYNDPTDPDSVHPPVHFDDGRVTPGDLGLDWYVGGKLGGLLGEGALGVLERLFGRTGSEALTQVLAKLTPAEKAMLEELIKDGHTVEPIARGAGQTADFLVDGVETELKTVTANGPNSVKNAIEKAASQTSKGNILIDARPSGIGTAEASGQVQRAAGNLGQSAVRGRVTVLTKSGTVKY